MSYVFVEKKSVNRK